MKKLKFLITGLLSAYMLCFPITNCSAETNQVIYGDANCDATVNICDVAALKQHLVGLKELSAQGIENCGFFNNEVTVKSLGQMTKYLIKEVNNLQFSYYDDGIYDEYLPKDNIDETYAFEDNIVMVQIKHQYSKIDKVWTKEDFGVDNIDYIEDLSITGFRQILTIHLKETGKDKVLKMIDDLENKNIPAIRCLAVSSYDAPC